MVGGCVGDGGWVGGWVGVDGRAGGCLGGWVVGQELMAWIVGVVLGGDAQNEGTRHLSPHVYPFVDTVCCQRQREGGRNDRVGKRGDGVWAVHPFAASIRPTPHPNLCSLLSCIPLSSYYANQHHLRTPHTPSCSARAWTFTRVKTSRSTSHTTST